MQIMGELLTCHDCGTQSDVECEERDMDYGVKLTCASCGLVLFTAEPEEKTGECPRPHTAGLVMSFMDSRTGYAGF